MQEFLMTVHSHLFLTTSFLRVPGSQVACKKEKVCKKKKHIYVFFFIVHQHPPDDSYCILRWLVTKHNEHLFSIWPLHCLDLF